MSDNGYLTIGEARDRLRQATKLILDAEATYERAVEAAADAEAAYRLKVAEAFRGHREAGTGAGEAETLARADAALASRERDAAAGMLRLASEKLENARDSRRSLWRLVEWSARHDAPVGRAREDVPGSEWP